VQVMGDLLLTRALDRAPGDGRNNAGLWLACQLRDNGYDQGESKRWMREYQERVPQGADAYTWDEALHSLDQAYQSPPRDAWEQPRPFDLNGSSNGHSTAIDDLSDALETAKAAVDELRNDPGAIYTDEALNAIAEIRRWDPANWARFSAEIKKRGSLKDFLTVLERRAPKAPLPAEAPDLGRRAGDMLDECPAPQLIIPPPYVLSETGTARVVQTDIGGFTQPIAPAPIVIAGRARDTLSGQESLLLSWAFENEPWRSRIVEREQAMVSRYISQLAGVGFPYIDTNAKDIATYISHLEAANRHTLPLARVSSQLGWQGKPTDDTSFLLGTTLIQPDGEIERTATLDVTHPSQWRPDRVVWHGATDGEQQIAAAYHQAGTYESWLEAVQRVAEHPRVMVFFYAAFCPPLLELFGVPNFVVSLDHPTTAGKTTALRLAASIYGNCDERTANSQMQTWSQTRVSIERRAAAAPHLPLFLDDTKTLISAKGDRGKQILAEIIYDIVSGHGRGRGTIQGLARVLHWRTVLFSTGEQPITSFTQDGGIRTRVVCITGCPLGQKNLEAGRLAQQLNAELCGNYGHAGARFLSWLMREREQWGEWRQKYQQWVEYYSTRPPTPEAGRLAQYLALITVTGEMVHQALELPWAYTNPLRQLNQAIAARAADAAGEERALEDVLDWAYRHERGFAGRNPNLFGDENRPHEVYGRWDAPGKWEYLGFYPTALDKVLEELGYQPTAIIEGWKSRGWLDISEKDKRNRKKVRINGEGQWLVALRRSAFEALEAQNEPQNEPQKEGTNG